jgi:hypothetical protein
VQNRLTDLGHICLRVEPYCRVVFYESHTNYM